MLKFEEIAQKGTCDACGKEADVEQTIKKKQEMFAKKMISATEEKLSKEKCHVQMRYDILD